MGMAFISGNIFSTKINPYVHVYIITQRLGGDTHYITILWPILFQG